MQTGLDDGEVLLAGVPGLYQGDLAQLGIVSRLLLQRELALRSLQRLGALVGRYLAPLDGLLTRFSRLQLIGARHQCLRSRLVPRGQGFRVLPVVAGQR